MTEEKKKTKQKAQPPSKTMGLWDQVCKTNPDDTKKVTFGRKFTAIDAYSQIRKATELWGPFGSKWGVREERYLFNEKFEMVFYFAQLFYPDNVEFGEIPIHSDSPVIHWEGKRKGVREEDITKKLATDALTKGLSKLGFNADIFLGKFDDNKYVQQMAAEFNGNGNTKPATLPHKETPKPEPPEPSEKKRFWEALKAQAKEEKVVVPENIKGFIAYIQNKYGTGRWDIMQVMMKEGSVAKLKDEFLGSEYDKEIA